MQNELWNETFGQKHTSLNNHTARSKIKMYQRANCDECQPIFFDSLQALMEHVLHREST